MAQHAAARVQGRSERIATERRRSLRILGQRAGQTVTLVLVVAWALISWVPLYWMLLTSLKTGQQAQSMSHSITFGEGTVLLVLLRAAIERMYAW